MSEKTDLTRNKSSQIKLYNSHQPKLNKSTCTPHYYIDITRKNTLIVELRFFYDDTFEQAQKINTLLNKINDGAGSQE